MLHYILMIYIALGISWALLDAHMCIQCILHTKIDKSVNARIQKEMLALIREIQMGLSVLPPLLGAGVLTVLIILMFGWDIISWPFGVLTYIKERSCP